VGFYALKGSEHVAADGKYVGETGVKRRPWWYLATGVGLSLAFAGPIVGAGSPLFWSYAADGNDPQRVARHTYQEVMRFGYGTRHFDYRVRRDRYARPLILANGRSCASEFVNRTDDGAVSLYSALDLYRDSRLLDEFDGPALRALAELPGPVLGAVAGCVEASLLRGACSRYVVRIADSANLAENEALRERRSVIVREAEQMWCATRDPESTTRSETENQRNATRSAPQN